MPNLPRRLDRGQQKTYGWVAESDGLVSWRGRHKTDRCDQNGRYEPGEKVGLRRRSADDVCENRILMKSKAARHHATLDLARIYMAISGSRERSFLTSGISVIVASVSRSTLATETAFSKAMRTTLAVTTDARACRSWRAPPCACARGCCGPRPRGTLTSWTCCCDTCRRYLRKYPSQLHATVGID